MSRRPKTLVVVEAMEEESGSSSPLPVGLRWNPTTDQIAVLEDLYRRGLRTPTAEEIHQIAGKLRVYGAIERKNIFYWFQNHKARQRQKQKQEGCCYPTHFFHQPVRPPPPPAPLPILLRQGHSNGALSNPIYIPFVPTVCGDGYYQPQFQQALAPAENKVIRPVPRRIRDPTLQLFPLHPTVVLERTGGSETSSSVEPLVVDDGAEGDGSENTPFFNFLGDNKVVN